ncbi:MULTISPECIES: DNA-directed RNA polymerase subunit P [Metallosphaera]|uniref:DNA-directed RNA polymerase subunit Rpo12 n=4 Tax=Metallosphaera TaxID=41980 RepID=A4YIU7_METS5|nr:MULTISPECIES: DNA-directed RNA polymerase subunit P [Metallosphaera]ABP96349.1 DNA-directed RNA polymerase, subunit P [Metallosphaera sedula DSM 5348]AEB94205.1 DNA-directed RNA polymerase subunit P [Metallosphaera cuprina Ar-4]AIM28332.1 DNA-directed RNA polymerase, subunit P [Metallosphaera sedula]MCH1770531.1 DNA-directed RNA polymerase subunit P [Metallosphaera sedula]MCP6728729.1 DNA-directed RNA polymerase subunit P [Metallosphaera sedula]
MGDLFRCGKCWKTFDSDKLRVLPGVRCPYCGYNIIYMIRKPTIKAVKAI